MRAPKPHSLLPIFLVVATSLTATTAAQSPDLLSEGKAWWAHVQFLADDALEGRNVGTPGYEKAVDYVESQFQAIGLKPAGTSGFRQPVKFDRRKLAADQSQLVLVRDGKEEPLVIGGDLNVTPADEDVWDAARAHGSTHVSPPERDALAALREWGLSDLYRAVEPAGGRFSWWDYRAGMFHRNEGMRIDLLYGTRSVAQRVVWAEIDREARKGPPTPSDHAPVVVDLDEPGRTFDAGWTAALARIQARTRPRRTT